MIQADYLPCHCSWSWVPIGERTQPAHPLQSVEPAHPARSGQLCLEAAIKPDIFLYRLASIAVLAGLLLLNGCASGTPKAGGRGVATPPVQTAAFSVNRPGELPGELKIKLREHRGYMFAPARINGREAGLFMFDTGSNLTVISTGVAGRLGLEVVGNSHAVGVGGTQAFDYRGFTRLEFGGVEVSGNRAAAISLHPMSNGIGISVSGLIGIRELGGLPFTLDYSDHTLTVYRRDGFTPPPGVRPQRARFDFAGLPVVEARIGNGHQVWLILDSGADNELTLPRKCLELWPDITAAPGSGSGHSAGVGGAVASTYTWISSINVFGLDLKDMPAQFEQAPEAFNRQPRPVGRIGGAFLKNFRLTMDPQRNLIWAEWLPGRQPE